MLLNSTAAAWTASPLDTCLDRLGVCEGTVSVCESRNSILEAELVLLRHLYVIIALACTMAVLGVITVLRLCWHVRVGAVAGAFPLDLCPGYVLRRIWRVVRWPFVRAFGQRVGPVAAEAMADAVDRMAVSPEVLVDPRYASIHRHPAAVPTFRSLPSGAVCGVQREGGSLVSSPVLSRAGSGLSVSRPVPPPPPPPMPSSVITVFHSAKSRQVAEYSRSCTNRPGTPATKKRLSVQPVVAFLSRHETIDDVSITFCHLSCFITQQNARLS